MPISHRVIATDQAPATSWANGRSYATRPGAVLSVPYGDALILEANGCAFLAMSTPASARPAPGEGLLNARRGTLLWDETLGGFVIFDGTTWRDPSTGDIAGDVAPTTTDPLLANAGPAETPAAGS